MRKLDDSQVESFDTEYVDGGRWDTIVACIDRDFPTGEFTFLDVGGGNGKFADRLLDHYPKARGTVVDNSEVLVDRNTPNPRKTLVLESVENLDRITEKYDLICVHWLLHHLVSDSYRETRENQRATLEKIGELLTPSGRVSMFENVYTGWWVENLPGWIIFQATSLELAAPITRRMGANTAGIGVCFLGKTAWQDTIRRAHLSVNSYREPDDWIWPLRMAWRLCLHLKQIRVGHFWLQRDDNSLIG